MDIFKVISGIYFNSPIPEASNINYPYDIQWLWEASIQENPYSTVTDHLSFLNDLDVDDYIKMFGKRQNNKQIIVSTIHKVKGLEYDNVCVLASSAGFPLEQDFDSIEKCAADETRLYYVAITRAKSRLLFEWGKREAAWAEAATFTNNICNNRQILSGSPKEIFISWSGFRSERQSYLEEHVKVGDQILLSNRTIMHAQVQIAKLSNAAYQGILPGSELYVADIIRYPITAESLHYDQIVDICKQREWLYVPLVSSGISPRGLHSD